MALQQSLHREVERARRYGHALSLCVVDLDHFKSINDAFGHPRGDAVLAAFRVRAGAILRESDLLFRYGGDEFVLLLPHTDPAQARTLGERLLEAVTGTPFAGEPPLSLTLSIGGATFPVEAADAEALFARADRRLYEAKRLGRGRVHMEDPPAIGRLDFAAATRLVEREEARAAVRAFFDALDHRERGLLTINGPAGAGHSRFLAEVIALAELRQYATLTLHARPGMRARLYGALTTAEGLPADLGAEPVEPTTFIQAVCRQVEERGKAGLVIAISEMAELDRATLDLIQALFDASGFKRVALVYTAVRRGGGRLPAIEPALQGTVELTPFSVGGTRLWLRAVLAWEAPDAFCHWLLEQTGGLPAVLGRALDYLVEAGVLRAAARGWTLRPDFAKQPLPTHVQAPPEPPVRLPRFAGEFVGRVGEIQAVKDQLEEDTLLTIVGPGGIGKTRLAVQAASEMRDRFPHGTFFVPLAPVARVDDMAAAIAAALRRQPAGTEDPKEALLAFLRDRRLLLVLDNAEHLLAGVGMLAEIREQAPGVTLLVTSREALHVQGEVALAVAGMPYPRRDDGGNLERFSAALLFLRRVRDRQGGFVPSQADRTCIARICEMVEGQPLGIELAAAWAPTMGCEAIAEAIARNIDFLSATPGASGAERSARAVLNYFWRTLSADEQRVLRHLSIFRGGFTREAAQQIAGASLFFLAALVDKAFLSTLETGRYQMHGLLRQYGGEALAQRPAEQSATQARHAAYYLALAESAEAAGEGAEHGAWLDRLDAEHDNARAALAWSTGAGGDSETGLRLAAAMSGFWSLRGHLTEGRRWLAQALAAGDTHAHAAPRPRARALAAAGSLATNQGDFAAARTSLEESHALWHALNDQPGMAGALQVLGNTALLQGDFVQAVQFYEEGLALYRLLEDQHGTTKILMDLGKVANHQGDYPRARSLYEEGLGVARARGNKEYVADALNGLAALASDEGHFTWAIPLYEEALAIRRELGHKRGVASILLNLGTVARNQGDNERAGAFFAQSVTLLQELGDRRGVAIALMQLGKLAYLQGQYAQAAMRYRETLEIIQAFGDRQITPFVLERMATLAGARGAYQRAATLCGASARLREMSGSPLPPADRAEYESDLAQQRSHLGDAAFEAALAEGYGWTLEQAIPFALEQTAMTVGA